MMQNDWNPGIWVLIWECPTRAIHWIPIWQGLDVFQKSLHPCALDEGSLSIWRVKELPLNVLSVIMSLSRIPSDLSKIKKFRISLVTICISIWGYVNSISGQHRSNPTSIGRGIYLGIIQTHRLTSLARIGRTQFPRETNQCQTCRKYHSQAGWPPTGHHWN